MNQNNLACGTCKYFRYSSYTDQYCIKWCKDIMYVNDNNCHSALENIEKGENKTMKYTKIDTIFKRDPQTKKLIIGSYTNESVAVLADLNSWEFTEKVDGTNIRIMWDGNRVSFGGKTDNAIIPTPLINRLNDLFSGSVNEQLFEQKFGTSIVTIFGEGYGGKIQNGGQYKKDVDFIMFDVNIDGVWIKRDACENIAKYFGINIVPILLVGTINDAIKYVLNPSNEKSHIAENGAPLEGIVGRPPMGLIDRMNRRIIVKIKAVDFE